MEKSEEVENLGSYSKIPIKGGELSRGMTNNQSINNNESSLVV